MIRFDDYWRGERADKKGSCFINELVNQVSQIQQKVGDILITKPQLMLQTSLIVFER